MTSVAGAALGSMLFVAICTGTAAATEYSLNAYLVPAARVAAAVGSGDAALKASILSDRKFIRLNGLDVRYGSPALWSDTVARLIDGHTPREPSPNGFAIEGLVRAVTKARDQASIGLPFADLGTVHQYLDGLGEREAAALIRYIETGDTREATDAGPLMAELGATEYPAVVSVIPVHRVEALLRVIPVLERAAEGLEAYADDPASPGAAEAEAALRRAATAAWTRYTRRQQDGDGTTDSALVERMVESDLADPYATVDSVTAAADQLPRLAPLLQRAAREKLDVVLVYSSW